jgi:hypothetical protein
MSKVDEMGRLKKRVSKLEAAIAKMKKKGKGK